MKRLRIVFAVLLALSLFTAACAEEEISMDARIGYDGLITYLRPMPVTVSVKNTGADFSGSVAVNVHVSQMYYDRYEFPITLASGAEKQIVFPVALMMRQDGYAVELLDENGIVVARTETRALQSAESSAVFVGVLSEGDSRVTYMNIGARATPGLEYEVWQTVPLNAETFPSDEKLLSAFQILVFDGFDGRTLTDAQKDAFSAWLENGGIAIVGGGAQAAAGYPFFQTYTGVKAGALEEKTGVFPALQSFVDIYKGIEDPSVMTNAAQGVEGTAEGNLIAVPAGKGAVVLATFDIGAKALSALDGMRGMWRDILKCSVSDEYAAALNRAYSSGYGNEYFNMDSVMSRIPVANQTAGWPIAAVMAVYLLLAGVILYLVLKKLDRREWMWLGVPALAVAGTVALFAMGSHLGSDKPMAVTYSAVTYGENGPQRNLYVAVTGRDREEVVLSLENGEAFRPFTDYSMYDGYYYSGNTQTVPEEMRFRYILSDKNAVGYPGRAAWSINYMTASGMLASDGDITGSAWMEEDGMHMEITNNTEHTLEDVLMYSILGYDRAEKILPGETVFLFLARPEQLEEQILPSEWTAEIRHSVIQEGKMVPNIVYTMNSGLYDVIDAIIYPDGYVDWGKMTAEEQLRANVLQNSYNYEDAMKFSIMVQAFVEDMGRETVLLNGEPITRVGHVATVQTELEYAPVGPGGIVYYPPGEIVAEDIVFHGASFDPDAPVFPEEDLTYFEMTNEPAFLFELPAGIMADELFITPTGYYEVMPVTQMYNFSSGEWDTFEFPEIVFSGSESAPYIGETGRMYVRYLLPDDFDGNSYAGGLNLPLITLEGRMEK